MLLDKQASCLLVVDIQTRLAPAVRDAGQTIANTCTLIEAAARLEVPLVASEQYPRGLGATVPEVAALLPRDSVVEKVEFACGRNHEIEARLRRLDRQQIVVAGMEAHVCVLQTVLSLLGLGFQTYVVGDAVASRCEESRQIALTRMMSAGAHVVTTEMVIFEWLERADSDDFRALLPLVK